MTSERVYYHVVFSVTRGKPVFLDDEIDAAFKREAREIARLKGWLLLEMETMPNHVHLLLEKAPWDDLSKMVGYLKGRTARAILAHFPWLRGDLHSYQFWNRSFHYTRHSDASLDTVRAYIRNQRRAGGLTE
ncbi:MAG TPA: IS200/IS605 family transposase [Ktedonobacterales bacterium]|jgi:putative transposase